MALITCEECLNQFSSSANKCPHCGKKRSWIKRHPILAFFLILIVISSITSGLTSNWNSNFSDNNQINSNLKNRDIIANVSNDGFQITILNLENIDWKNCRFELNNKYKYPAGNNTVVGEIEAGSELSIGLALFVLKDGTKFNPFQTQTLNFSISCDNGWGYYTW